MQGNHWFLWAVLLPSAVYFLYRVEKRDPAPILQRQGPGRWNPRHVAILLAVGAFFLLYRLNHWPNWMTQDEGAYMWVGAHHFNSGQNVTPFFADAGDDTGLPEMFFHFFFKMFGVSLFSAILFPALLTLVCLPFVYGFALYFVPEELALLMALLFAVSRWILFFVRNAHVVDQVPAAEAACLYFFVSALGTGRKKYFAWFGLALAFCFHTYLGGRVFAALAAAFFLFFVCFYFNRARQNAPRWLYAWGVFILFMLPMAVWYWKTPLPPTYKHSPLISRFLELSVFSHFGLKGNGGLRLFGDELRGALSMFNVHGMENAGFNLPGTPMLDPLTGFCFWIGLGWVFFRAFQSPLLLAVLGMGKQNAGKTENKFSRFPFLFLALGFLGTLSAGVFTVDEAANPMRMIITVPFALIFAVIGLWRMVECLGMLVPQKVKKLNSLFYIFMALFAAVWNYNVYFQKIPQSSQVLRVCGHREFLAAQTLGKYPAGWDLCDVTRGAWYQKLVYTYQKGKLHDFLPIPPDFPLRNVPEKGALLFMGSELEIFKDWIKFYYPRAKNFTVPNAFGENIFWAWELTPSDVRDGLRLANTPPPGGVRISAVLRDKPKTVSQIWPSIYGLEDWIQQWVFVRKCMVKTKLGMIKRPLLLEACGQVKVYLNGVKVGELPSGLDTLRLNIPALAKPSELNIEYRPIGDHFRLALFYQRENGPWLPLPASAFSFKGLGHE